MVTPAPKSPPVRRRAPPRPRVKAVTEAPVPVIDGPVAGSVPFAWLTVELLLYVVLTMIALATRFWNLGEQPLSPRESSMALAAYRFDVTPPSEVGALLRHVSAVTMALFGDTDYTARLLPALAGGALPAVVSLLRPALGRTATLIGAGLLAVSPVLVDQSRLVGNGAFVAVFGLAAFALALRVQAVPRAGEVRALALTIAGLLVAGPIGYNWALIAIVIVAFLWRRALVTTSSLATSEILLSGEIAGSARPIWSGWRLIPASLIRQAGYIVVGVIIVLSTGALLNVGGLEETLSAAIGSWVGGWFLPSGWPGSSRYQNYGFVTESSRQGTPAP